MSHLDIVAEDLVIADLEIGDTCLLGLLFLVVSQPALAVPGDGAQSIEVFGEARSDDAAVSKVGGWFRLGHFLLGILILYILFYYFAQVLLALPSDFHEGTLWRAGWWTGS